MYTQKAIKKIQKKIQRFKKLSGKGSLAFMPENLPSNILDCLIDGPIELSSACFAEMVCDSDVITPMAENKAMEAFKVYTGFLKMERLSRKGLIKIQTRPSINDLFNPEYTSSFQLG